MGGYCYCKNRLFSVWPSLISLPRSRDSYHGYWAKNITGLNNHFGTSDDLAQLSSALHSRGMVRPSVFSCSHNASLADCMS